MRNTPTAVIVRVIDVNSAEGQDIVFQLESISSPARIETLCEHVLSKVVAQGRVLNMTAPDWYTFPDPQHASEYLLRLEQQLALVMNSTEEEPQNRLSGAHEIIKGAITLCVSLKQNSAIRMLCTQTIAKMIDIDRDVVRINLPMIQELVKDLPEGGEIGRTANSKLNEIIAELS